MITYLDTSVLIKLIVEESGSGVAAALWDGSDTLASARIGYVEARAALAAAQRAGRLTVEQLRHAKSALDDLWSQLAVVEITAELIVEAGRLAEVEGLRGYDAVHLAAAITVGADVLASADSQLAQAATRLGFHTATAGGG